VVGAGLCGLTAAYRLRERGWTVDVYESEDRAGGRVQTVREQGYAVDTGATALAASYVAYTSLVRELGLQVRPAAPCLGIYRDGRVHLLRMDQIVRSGLTTRLLSTRSKLRLARLGFDVTRARLRGQLDYADMRKAAPLDTESSRQYALRALNAEIDSYLCGPIVRAMLIADTDKVSRVELFSGVANIFTTEILALAGGQGTLTERLADEVGVQLRTPVRRVVESVSGVDIDFRRPDGSDGHAMYDAAVVTCPLPVAVDICPAQRPALEPLSRSLGYTRCITVGIGTTRAPDCPAFLVQMPTPEDAEIALLFLDHNKAADRAPAGHGLISACWETDAATAMFDAPDDAIVERTLETVFRVFPELRGTVDFVEVTRWARALPKTSIGSYQQIGAFNAGLDPSSRLQFAADFMSAAGQNTAVEFGTRAAAAVQALNPRPTPARSSA
jgi:oxygen-dependent protoporphyrinogen oxidase